MLRALRSTIPACLVAAALLVTGCDQASLLVPAEEAPDVASAEGLQSLNSSSDAIPDQYIVVFREDAPNARGLTQRLARANRVDVLHTYTATIRGFAFRGSARAAAALANNPNVAYVEPDQVVALAPPCHVTGTCDDDGGGSTGQTTPYGITRVNGGVTYTGSSVAWILDTGIDLDHEDLNVDATRGFNAFTSGRDSKTLDDGNGHGSHVAGTVAAIDNEVGVVGVAAGATVIPVKVLDSRGSGSYSGVIAGIDHVGKNGRSGDVANMSLGGGYSKAVNDAVVAASRNVKFSLAAGNDGDDANDYSPASANGSNIYTISAINASDVFASFSNWGNPPVDYAAPGVSIESTYKDGGYRSLSGTSMAAPHVAGVLLLGSISTSGTASGDPDGNADPIASAGSAL